MSCAIDKAGGYRCYEIRVSDMHMAKHCSGPWRWVQWLKLHRCPSANIQKVRPKEENEYSKVHNNIFLITNGQTIIR